MPDRSRRRRHPDVMVVDHVIPPMRSAATRSHGVLVDLAIVVVVSVVPTVVRAVRADPHAPFEAVDVAAAALAAALVPARRRFPIATLAVGVLTAGVVSAWSQRPTVLLPVVIILLFSAATRVERRAALLAGATTIVSMYTIVTVLFGAGALSAGALASIAWPGLAVAAGDAIRNRRAYIAAVEERARRAEHTREEEARRRVVEERLRIARDLHDVVAHRMVIIKVQADVAAHLLRAKPDEAEQALAVVRSSAGTVLDELGGMLGVLRDADDPAAPRQPAPTLNELPALVESFSDAGLEVQWESSGRIRPLPESVQLATYRLIQEGLTNAQRHGDGHAHLATTYDPHRLEVVIENGIPDPSNERSGGGGRGIIGMRERVAAAGGTLKLGPTPHGSFQVIAQFPVNPEEPT